MDYLNRIRNEASTAPRTRKLDLLGLEACYLARIGHTERALEIAQDLRESYRDDGDGRALVWAMLVDGLGLYFSSLGASATDRVRRCYEVSRLVASPRLWQLSAAWLAHLEFEQYRFERVVALVLSILRGNEPLFPDAAARVGLVLGDAYLYAGNRSKSNDWYRVAHVSSLRTSDRVGIGALMYNRAAFSVSRMRVERAAGQIGPSDEALSFASTELASAKSFERAIGVVALSHLIPLVEARISILRGHHRAALEKLESITEAVEATKRRSEMINHAGDIAYCSGRLGDASRAVEFAKRILGEDFYELDRDDRVVVSAQILEVVRSQSQRLLFDELKARFELARDEYMNDVSALLLALRTLPPPADIIPSEIPST